MDGDQEFRTAAERAEAMALAEAMSRKAESEAAVFAGSVDRAKNPEGYKSALEEKIKAGEDARRELERVNAISVQPDLSGMNRGLSDSAGNFAANVGVLTTGGIGVEASNTNVATGEPAQTAEEAGVQLPTSDLGGVGMVAIPEDWRGRSWQERRSLAAQFSKTPIKTGDEADAAIEAELKAREG